MTMKRKTVQMIELSFIAIVSVRKDFTSVPLRSLGLQIQVLSQESASDAVRLLVNEYDARNETIARPGTETEG